MKAVFCLLLAIAALARADENTDRQAVRDVIAAFNDLRQRPAVLAPGADIPSLQRFAGPEVSQLYFEAKSIRFVTPDVAFVDAAASQFGTTILKRTLAANFVLRRMDGAWKIAILRVNIPRYPTGIVRV
jgi:hypothetical protein